MITFNWQAQEKLKNFTPENTSLVTDFDGTVISGTSKNSFSVFIDVLGLEYAQKAQRLYMIFGPHEANHELDLERKKIIMARWWKNHLWLFAKTPLTKDHLTHELTRSVVLRRGMESLISRFHENAIPTMVFSAGVAQVIDMVLERYFGNSHNIKVAANRLSFTPDWVNNGTQDVPIHVVNKTDHDFPHLFSEEIRSRTHVIVVGDSLSDSNMVTSIPLEKRLTVGFLNNPDDLKRKIFGERFDIVIESSECDGWLGEILLKQIWII